MLATVLLALGSFPERSISLERWFYLFLAFFSARSVGMCLNRLIDRYIDAENPRTRHRPIPRGEISVRFAATQVAVFMLLFFFSCWNLGLGCFLLSCAIGVLVSVYSYLKRITALCHFGLGLVHMLVPITTWVACVGVWSIEPVLLGLSLLCSIAAGDILYACQDIEFDRSHGLKSIPARFGIPKSVDLAKLLHCLSVLFLVIMADFFPGQPVLLPAALAVAGVYYICYKRLMKFGFEKSFFFANTYSGLSFFLFVLLECVWRAL